MGKPPSHPLDRALVEIVAMLRAIADRQAVIEQALIHVARGEALPAGLGADRLNAAASNADAARELIRRRPQRPFGDLDRY